MAMIEIRTDPTLRELRIFAALWLVFFGVMGRIAVSGGGAMLIASAVTGGCFLLSVAFNRDFPRREQRWGAAFPVGLFALWAAAAAIDRGGVDPATAERVLFVGLAAVGVVGAATVLGSRAAGRGVYRAWMLAAMPIGWTLSNALLMAVFYGVVTPVGLVMRAIGRDPMAQRFDEAAASYWVEHRPPADPKRYLRQS